MKRIITILICSININLSYAQFDENNAFYLSNELNLGNYIGVDVNLNYIIKENIHSKLDIQEI